jgi:hypothetical protein
VLWALLALSLVVPLWMDWRRKRRSAPEASHA